MKRRSFFGSMAAALAAPVVAKSLVNDLEKDIAYELPAVEHKAIVSGFDPIVQNMESGFSASAYFTALAPTAWIKNNEIDW